MLFIFSSSFQLHFIAYNAEIYANYSIASGSPRGLAVVAVFLTVRFLKLFHSTFTYWYLINCMITTLLIVFTTWF